MGRGLAHVVLEWLVPPWQVQPVAAALQGVMLATRREPGCLRCVVSTSVSDRVRIRFEEDWETEEQLRRHVRSEGFRAVATLVEEATEPPSIEFMLPSGTRGIDYATEACAAS